MTHITRRSFLKTTAAGAATIPLFNIAKAGPSPNSKVNVAMIGCGGVAHQAFQGAAGENLVALCDVDKNQWDAHAKRFSPIKDVKARFTDFRVMLDKMGKEIDMICVSTPDHTHFAATIAAMERGIHVFTQKPLVHNIWQARTLRKAAREYKVKTNMGNQGHTSNGIRQMREWYEAGVFGQITEAHSYCPGPKWGGTYFKMPDAFPLSKDPVPESLDWDLWQGPTGPANYHKLYHPRTWRAFNPYGTGTLGDWFCHIADAPVWVLDLYEPVSVELEQQDGGKNGMAPDGCRIRFDFVERGSKKPCTFYWTNGGPEYATKTPEGWTWPGNGPGKGTLYIGEKQLGFTDNRSNNPRLGDKEAMKEFKEAGYPAEKYPRVKGGPIKELVDVVKGEMPEAGSHFEYAARMTETMLLGLLVTRHGGKIEWDAKKMRITNRPELNAYLKEPVREGWEYGEGLWKK